MVAIILTLFYLVFSSNSSDKPESLSRLRTLSLLKQILISIELTQNLLMLPLRSAKNLQSFILRHWCSTLDLLRQQFQHPVQFCPSSLSRTTETGHHQWWSKQIPKLFHVAHVVDIVVEVVFAVIAPDDLAVCFDALALGGGHRHSGRHRFVR